MRATFDIAQATLDARKQWGWYLALGILLIVAGAVAIMNGTAATLASLIVLGAVLFIGGIIQILGAFMAHGAGHVILMLLVGILDLVVGAMFVSYPQIGALTVTLLLAAVFVFSGIFRFVAALWLQFPQYGWVAFSGAITFILGALLWSQWPVSATWFIGFAVGVNFIIAGVAWSALAWRLKPA